MIVGGLKDLAKMHVLGAFCILPATMWFMQKTGIGDQSRRMHFELTESKTRQRQEMGTGRVDFLDGLIRSGMGLAQIKENASLLIIAGSETTATLLTGAVFMLTTHTDVLEKLTREVRGLFKSKKEINITSVGNLSYMPAVLNETLRHYPPVAISAPRVVPAEGAEICGHHVPRGAIVEVWQWAMYHDSTLFADPNQFDPERFAPPDQRNHKFANDRLDCVNPFLVGSRNCIGKTLAYAEMRLILARLIWEFDMVIREESRGWLKDQKNWLMWDKPVLNVHLRPVES